MNRERGLESYRRELGFDPLESLASGQAWLDLGCGQGRALMEAAARRPDLRLVGLDLIAAASSPAVEFVAGAARNYQPQRRFALITMVHSLHYVGDKLGLLGRAASWLDEGGQLVAHLDLANLLWLDGRRAGPWILARLRQQGWLYHGRRRLLSRTGPAPPGPLPAFAGADPSAGPNFTGQAAVHSVYRRPHELSTKHM
ncbi:MAG: methyltransferase domain-containing protein [Candidatus Eremiobacteraeota bacterium]|nr:methyltransferase domain-containing protein [Candidatus Eremiobacteraeota bacterium]